MSLRRPTVIGDKVGTARIPSRYQFVDHSQYYDFLNERAVPSEGEQRGRILRDGNAWCVCGPGFEDPVMSAFGCETLEEAYTRWRSDAEKRPEWRKRQIPAFEDFAIER